MNFNLLKYFLRLVRSTFCQWSLQFPLPHPEDLSGKTGVVTGGNDGIGLETVKHLAQQGMTVILACRNTGKGLKAVEMLERVAAGKELHIHVVELDLADLQSVANFAKRVKLILQGRPLDLLVHNAGVQNIPCTQSKQGHEMHFAVNHLGPFLLTRLLLPSMKSPGGRVVFVNAELHTLATEASPDFEYASSSDVQPYARSKLASLWFAYDLQRRRPDLICPVLHPGVIRTKMAQGAPRLIRWFFISVPQGAQTTLHCSLAPGVKGWTYYHNSLGVVPSSEASYDRAKAAAMWTLSEGLTQPFMPATAKPS